jgi:hypothetical protein
MEVDGAVLDVQFGYLNFHAKQYRGSGTKLTVTIKNKWAAGWTNAWFYCKDTMHVCPQGGKSVHALCSDMSALELFTELPVDCLDTNAGDVTFVKATGTIGGHDAVQDHLACVLYPLSASFSLGEVANGITPVSKLRVPLPKFFVLSALTKRMMSNFWRGLS